MNLKNLLDSAIGETAGHSPWDVAGKRIDLQSVVGTTDDPYRYDGLLASLFWQIFLVSPAYAFLRNLEFGQNPFGFQRSFSDVPLLRRESMIVPHGDLQSPQYNLLILETVNPFPYLNTSHIDGSSFRAFTVSTETIPDLKLMLAQGTATWRTQRLFGLNQALRLPGLTLQDQQFQNRLIRAVGDEFAWEIAQQNLMHLVFAPLPDLYYTQNRLPIWQVDAQSAGTILVSTAGLSVSKNNGLLGVTASLHAIGGGHTNLCLNHSVTIDNSLTGVVRDADPISDSCFIEMAQLPQRPYGVQSTGPLVNITPRQWEQCTFDGVTNSNATAIIQAWSPDIPFVLPYNQLKVFTDDVTSPGDSGAALIDAQGNAIGFSFYRGGPQPTISAWIWAHSVFTALGLTAI